MTNVPTFKIDESLAKPEDLEDVGFGVTLGIGADTGKGKVMLHIDVKGPDAMTFGVYLSIDEVKAHVMEMLKCAAEIEATMPPPHPGLVLPPKGLSVPKREYPKRR